LGIWLVYGGLLRDSNAMWKVVRPDLGGVQGVQPGRASKCNGPQIKN